MKILIVEDEQVNAKLLKYHVENFFKENSIEDFIIDTAQNGLEALGLNLIKKYDVMFLDVRMPKFDGIKVLNTLKHNKMLNQPYICMVTSLGEDKYKNLFKLLNAKSYLIKPYQDEKIHLLLSKLCGVAQKTPPQQEMHTPIQVNDSVIEEDCFEFDFDFDDGNEGEILEGYEKISAQEFLKDFESLDYILEDIQEIDDLMSELIEVMDIDSLEKNKENIIYTLKKYETFLHSLMQFDEISRALNILANQIDHLDLSVYEDIKKTFIIELIRGIIDDLSSWKNFVFIEQSTQDVNYINDSVLSNCVQLNKLIGEI